MGTFATKSDVLAMVLGVSWNARSDTLIYDLDEQRKYVSTLPARIFDPLGILSPFIIRIKILFQGMCSEKNDLGR